MENQEYLKKLINSANEQPIDFEANEVGSFLSKKANKPINKLNKNVFFTLCILFFGAGLCLIKIKKPNVNKPNSKEAIVLLKTKETEPINTKPLSAETKTKKHKLASKNVETTAILLDTNLNHIEIFTNNENEIDYTAYNNITETNSYSEYNNVNDLTKN
jgi:hypothetical protein